MTQTSLFFDSVSGDRIYTSAAWSQIWGALFPNGVVANNAGQLVIGPDGLGTMNVSVASGAAFVQGKFYQNDAQFTIPVTTSDPTNPRIDRVILRVDYTARTLTCLVKAGTPAVSPSPPALTTTLGVTWEYSLAQVAVAAGATGIVSANITTESTLVASNAYLSFGKVKGGANTALATLPNDTVEIVAGTNIAVSTNVATKQVTVGVSGTVAHATLADTATAAGDSTTLGGHAVGFFQPALVASEFRAFAHSAQTIPATTWTQVLFGDTAYNTGGFSTSTGAFTAPVTGTWLFTFHMLATFQPGGNAALRWKINGTAATPVRQSVPPNDSTTAGGREIDVASIVKLNAGDVMTLEMLSDFSVTTIVSGTAGVDVGDLDWTMRQLP